LTRKEATVSSTEEVQVTLEVGNHHSVSKPRSCCDIAHSQTVLPPGFGPVEAIQRDNCTDVTGDIDVLKVDTDASERRKILLPQESAVS
jgi:hypothetical protein